MNKRRYFVQEFFRDFTRQSSCKSLVMILVLFLAFLCTFISAAAAQPVLEVTPISWNITGLDSNSPASGPYRFPVGARVCNTGDTNAGNVTTSFIWDDGQGVFVGDVNADLYLNLRAGSFSSVAIGTLAAGSCSDAYFEVEVTKVAAAFDKTRRYHITATDSGSGATGSSPQPRELYVEHLISQNRNSVTNIELNGTSIPAGGTMNLLVGNTYEIKLYGGTATQGYEQFEAFINFPNTIFQILSVETSYSADTSIYVDNPNDKLYADACLWENDPNNPNYRSCVGAAGKAGGSNVVTTYTVKILSGAGTSQTLNSLLYDFSGSSFHYNADYGVGSRIVNIFGPSSVTILKSFTPKAISPGGTSTMSFKINNPTTETITGVNFTDSFPSGLAVYSTPGVSFSGCGTGAFSPAPAGGETSLSFINGTIAPNSVCTISLTVTASAGTYPNTTSSLKIYGTTDTGNLGTDMLSASSAPTCTPGQTIAQWTFPAGFNISSPAPSTGSGTAAPGPGVNAASFAAGSNSWGSNGSIATGATLNTANNDYFQFVINTADYSSIDLTFDARRGNSANSPVGVAVYYGSTAGNPETGTSLYSNSNVLTTTLTNIGGTLSFTPPAPTTYVRIYFFNSGNTNPGSDGMMDNVTFSGCAIPTPPPIISKSFSPDPIVKGANSTLTFAINNTQPGNKDLTGISFTDVLPAGLEINNPNGLSGSCGGGTITAVAETQTISLSGASLAAGTSCNFSVSVKGAAAGNYENVTDFLSTTQTGTTTSYATDTLTVIAPPVLEKSFSPSSILVADTSTLTFTVNNKNLNEPLSGISFTDMLPAGLTVITSGPTSICGGSLSTTAPGTISFSGGSLSANTSCDFDITVTGTTVGSKDNLTSTVSSLEGGSGYAAAATLIVSNPQPLLGLNKQISIDGTNWFKFVGVALPGDLYYRFTISNDGETALSTVSVTDPDVTLCALPASLAIGSSSSCVVGPLSVTAVPTPNPFMNTATADSIETNPVTSSARYGTKSLSLDKSADSSEFNAVGDLLTYSYVVQNNGGYPLLGPLTLSDDKSVDETCPDVSTIGDFDNYLDQGESITCSATYTVQAQDVTNEFVTNTASASAGGATSNTDSVTVIKPNPRLSIAKSASPSTYSTVGAVINYSYLVTNSGNVTLSGPFSVSDDKTTNESCPPTASLAPGASITCTSSYSISQADLDAGSVINIASATNGVVTSPTDTGTVTAIQLSALTIAKSASPTTYSSVGTVINYSYIVTNSGNVTLSGPFSVSDNKTTNESCPPTASLSPGASITCTSSYTITQADLDAGSVTNIASATNGIVTSPTDTETVTAVLPALAIAKSAAPSTYSAVGEVISYSYLVTNTGNVTLSGPFTVSDDKTTNESCPPTASLATGASITCTSSYSITQADLDAGSVTNIASVTNGVVTSPTDTETVTAGEPNVFDPPSGFKTVNSAGYPELVWRMVWINNGNADAVAAVITDSIPANTSYIAGSLTCAAQGGSITDQCSYDSGNNRIVWQGTIAADPGALNETQAQNEVIITFRTTMNTSVTRVENQGCAQIPGGDTSCTDNPATPASGDPTVWTKSGTAVSVPTLNEWGFIILIILQGMAALYYLRRRVRS